MKKPTRRKFLKSALVTPLAVVAGGPPLHGLSVLRGLSSAAQGSEQFENPQIIRYDAQCFTLNGQDTFIHSGCFHYARCPRELWADRLMKFKQAGFNAIETYVFWNYHEPIEGHADLSEFEDYVKAVHKMGLWLIVRVGPYACAEWDYGGFPDWIIAEQFPLRSASPKSIQTSRHWYDEILPAVQRNMITTGGPIILIQIENEYDYWPLPASEKTKYITALANMVWDAGINIPIFTNWCREALDKSNPVMARITDTADFYPRWKIVQDTLGPLAQIRKRQPASPLGVAELQGGWFSRFGGKLSIDQPGISAAQLNALTKTMIEHGVTTYSYYMGFGGTNFDWAGKGITTTYDYAAPIREPGGLWEKYYAARGICAVINRFEPLLARARAISGPQCANPNVSVTERVNGQSGFLFVRENADAEQHFKMSFPDPASPTHRMISVPRQGRLTLGARNMKLLPVQVPLTGGHLRYTTAELLDAGANVDRSYVIVYDEPGALVEIGLATEQEPQVQGETTYQYWDSPFESVVIGFDLEAAEKMLLLNGNLQVIALPRERALRTWTTQYPIHVIPEVEGTGNMQVPFITDSALMGETGWEKHRAWADLYLKPGEHELTTLWPLRPDHCRVDEAATPFSYDSLWRTARLRMTTPKLPVSPPTLGPAEFWVEKFDLQAGGWHATPLIQLEKLAQGRLPYGYVKYRGEFSATQPGKMRLSAFDDDGRRVFINGKELAEASKPSLESEFDVSSYLKNGSNLLEVSYELFGGYNFGPQMARLKGLKSAALQTGSQGAVALNPWQIQLVPAAMRGRDIDPDYSQGGWQPGQIGGLTSDEEWLPAFCWVRTAFTLDAPPDEWSVMWKVTVEAGRDALLYLNGRFVGRYVTEGPQTEFYLPETFLRFGAKQNNILTAVVAYTDQPALIRTLELSPYEEFATRRTRVEFRW